LRGEGPRWELTRCPRLLKKRTFSMILQRKPSIATVADILSEKWWHVKIPTVRDNGSTRYVLRRRIFLKSGTVPTAKNKETKQRIQTPEDTLSTKSQMPDVHHIVNILNLKWLDFTIIWTLLLHSREFCWFARSADNYSPQRFRLQVSRWDASQNQALLIYDPYV